MVSGTASTRKAKIFSLNAAKLFGMDVDKNWKELLKNYRSQVKMAYLDEVPNPSHYAYG